MPNNTGDLFHVVVVMGGPSPEADVSRSSGAECARALETCGYRVSRLEAGRDLAQDLVGLQPDVIFNALHGHYGEDGCVQGLFEWLGIPYTHSGVAASALAMDKTRAKECFARAGLPVAHSVLVETEALQNGHPVPLPYVVKPNSDGSSCGVHIVRDEDYKINDMRGLGDVVMVEAYVPGRELTTSVVQDRALGVTEIVSDDWYDYAAKYEMGGSHHILPADIPPEIYALAEDYALRAHRVLGCRGLSRTDFRWDEEKGAAGLIVLETNTQPGMTPTSLAPEQAAYHGMDFPALCDWIVKDASCRR